MAIKRGAMSARTTTVKAEVPTRLLKEMEVLVEAGWFRDIDELVRDALRQFVESHRGALVERLNREDVEWGLQGEE